MKEIELTQNQVALVDDDDYEFLMSFKWHAQRAWKGKFYAYRRVGKGKISMHRIIMNAKHNQIVDHKDRNGLNNTRENLRFCSNSENGSNRSSFGRSKYLGVHYLKYTREYKSKVSGDITYYRCNYIRASIKNNGKIIHIGSFKTEEEAALAYNKMAIELHGEFANLNIIENDKLDLGNNKLGGF